MATATKTKRRSIVKTHERIEQVSWEPTYYKPLVKHPTRYKFPRNAKDPMKQIMREYLPMELEKDDRVLGGLDAGLRADVPNTAHRRWLEVLKPFLMTSTNAEISAGRAMSLMINGVPITDLRNAYHVQFIDEMRHSGQQMNLARWYAKSAPDPAGWHLGQAAYNRNPLTRASFNCFSDFLVGDPIRCSMALQVIGETAFTNNFFVATPDVGARNGDFAMPTVFHSVQSDEARHISNGFATLMTVVQDSANHEFIKHDMQEAFWVLHAFLDPFLAMVCEYFAPEKPLDNMPERWDRWVYSDWYRSYIPNLARHGIDIPPDVFESARARIHNGLAHRMTQLVFALWPLHFWRTEPLNQKDFEWFELKYPGWHETYGGFYEAYATMTDPKDHQLLLKHMMSQAPPFCWSCQVPAVFEEDICHRVVDGRTRFYCSDMCRQTDTSRPGRYQGDRNWFDKYHGWDLADVIRDLGFVRSDGKTLIGQPHFSDEPAMMWTLDDIEKCECTIVSPNIRLAEEMGLPNGSSVGAPIKEYTAEMAADGVML